MASAITTGMETVTRGANILWTNPTGGLFSDPTNWQFGAGPVPGASDVALFSTGLSGQTFTVDFNANATNNRLIVAAGNATFDLNGNTYQLTNPGTSSTTTSIVVGEATSSNGTLMLSDGTLQSQMATIANFSGSIGSVTITGSSATWNASLFHVGSGGTGALSISNGGKVNNTQGSIGDTSSGQGTATVNGIGSVWTNSGELAVGKSGHGTLIVENGGKVSNTIGRIGSSSNAPGGTATVRGAGSQWTNSGQLIVAGGSNTAGELSIENGGKVSNTTGHVGGASNAQGIVTVSGAGSTWTNSSSLSIAGFNNYRGTLTIENGGKVTNTTGEIAAGSAGNNTSVGTVTVTGNSSVWTNSSWLRVGSLGTGTLTIENGGSVSNTDGSIGTFNGSNGTVTVTGQGTVWNNTSNLVLGGEFFNGSALYAATAAARLTIADGGTVNVGNTIYVHTGDIVDIQTNTTLNAGTVLITPSGILQGSGNIFAHGAVGKVLDGVNLLFNAANGAQQTIGFGTGGQMHLNMDGAGAIGIGNGTLTVSEGTTVRSTFGTLGDRSGTSSTGIVTGANSRWINSGLLKIGEFGVGELTIANGGSVSNTNGLIASINPSTQGMVLVTGVGSTWTSSGSLSVGSSGSAGELTIENGGAVSNTFASIGTATVSSLGTVTVTGAGSTWTNSSQLNVNRGTLTIENGGLVSDTSGSVGSATPSAGIAIVTGGNSKWLNSTSFAVASGTGSGTVTIENGGLISNTTGTIAAGNTSTGNVTVTGAGSTWTNTVNLILSGTSLTTANTGTGTLDILDGGLVTVTGTTKLHGGATVIVDGGTLRTASLDRTTGSLQHRNGNVEINGGTFTQGAGTFVISGNAPTALPSFQLLTGATTSGVQDIRVGNMSNQRGNLVISGGSSLTTNSADIAFSPNSHGEVTVTGSGSSWTNSGMLNVGTGGAGFLTIDNGSTVNVGDTLTIHSGGTLQGMGQINGNVVNHGHFKPEFRGGTPNIFGNYNQGENGHLYVSLDPVQDRPILVLGETSLKGILHVDLSAFNNQEIDPEQQFTILQMSSFNPDNRFFDDIVTTGYTEPLSLQLVIIGEGPASYFLRRAPSLRTLGGDANQNGVIDSEDFQAFAAAMYDPDGQFSFANGRTLYGLRYFFDLADRGEWVIDFDDLAEFSALIAPSVGSLAAAQGMINEALEAERNKHVPEPQAWLLLCMAVLPLVWRRAMLKRGRL